MQDPEDLAIPPIMEKYWLIYTRKKVVFIDSLLPIKVSRVILLTNSKSNDFLKVHFQMFSHRCFDDKKMLSIFVYRFFLKV